jgi:hypothetical protein
VPHPWFPKGGSWVFFYPQPTAHSLRPDRLHLPLNLRRLPHPPLALQIIKILQVQPEFRIRLEILRVYPCTCPLLTSVVEKGVDSGLNLFEGLLRAWCRLQPSLAID